MRAMKMMMYNKLIGRKFIPALAILILSLSINNTSMAKPLNLGNVNKEKIIVGCWKKEKSKENHTQAPDYSFALLCFSMHGAVHGFFLERDGLGGDQKGGWILTESKKIKILNHYCAYNIKNSNTVLLRSCAYSGIWKLKCKSGNAVDATCSN